MDSDKYAFGLALDRSTNPGLLVEGESVEITGLGSESCTGVIAEVVRVVKQKGGGRTAGLKITAGQDAFKTALEHVL